MLAFNLAHEKKKKNMLHPHSNFQSLPHTALGFQEMEGLIYKAQSKEQNEFHTFNMSIQLKLTKKTTINEKKNVLKFSSSSRKPQRSSSTAT